MIFSPLTGGGPTVDNSHPLIDVFSLHCQGPSSFYLSNPLHPTISMHILHTVLYTYPKMLAMKVFLNNQELL